MNSASPDTAGSGISCSRTIRLVVSVTGGVSINLERSLVIPNLGPSDNLRALRAIPQGCGDTFVGSQSSIRLPSGSMIHPNFPKSYSPMLSSTRTPSFLNCSKTCFKLLTRKLNMNGDEPGSKYFVSCGKIAQTVCPK